MTLIRSLLFQLWMYGAMALVGGLGIPYAMTSRPRTMRIMRTWSKVSLFGLRWICGVRTQFAGLEHLPAPPYLIAAKHQAMLDILLPWLIAKDPIFVVKIELLRTPIFGWYMKHSGQILVDREGHAATLKQMVREARAHAAAGRTLIIFPEGTRQEPGAAPDYKPGIAAIYRDLGLPCVPAGLNSGRCWPANGILMRPGLVTMRFAAPIQPGLSREAFMTALEEAVERETAAVGG